MRKYGGDSVKMGAGNRERGRCGGGSNPGGRMDDECSPGGMSCPGGGTMEAAIFELIDLRYCCPPVDGVRSLLTGLKAPYTSALFALNFSISSTSHARGSISASTSESSFSSHESGSLKMFAAMALPGIP